MERIRTVVHLACLIALAVAALMFAAAIWRGPTIWRIDGFLCMQTWNQLECEVEWHQVPPWASIVVPDGTEREDLN